MEPLTVLPFADLYQVSYWAGLGLAMAAAAGDQQALAIIAELGKAR